MGYWTAVWKLNALPDDQQLDAVEGPDLETKPAQLDGEPYLIAWLTSNPNAGQSGTEWVQATEPLARFRFEAIQAQLQTRGYGPEIATLDFCERAMGLRWDFSAPLARSAYVENGIDRKRSESDG